MQKLLTILLIMVATISGAEDWEMRAFEDYVLTDVAGGSNMMEGIDYYFTTNSDGPPERDTAFVSGEPVHDNAWILVNNTRTNVPAVKARIDARIEASDTLPEYVEALVLALQSNGVSITINEVKDQLPNTTTRTQ